MWTITTWATSQSWKEKKYWCPSMCFEKFQLCNFKEVAIVWKTYFTLKPTLFSFFWHKIEKIYHQKNHWWPCMKCIFLFVFLNPKPEMQNENHGCNFPTLTVLLQQTWTLSFMGASLTLVSVGLASSKWIQNLRHKKVWECLD